MADTTRNGELVSVLVTGEEGLFLLAKSVLADQGIDFLVRGDYPDDQFSGGRVGSVFNLVTGPAELLVRPEDAHRARALLDELQRALPATEPPAAREPSDRPLDGEFAAYAKGDIDQVAGSDAIAALRMQGDALVALFDPLDDALVAGLTYADGKWTLKEVLGHLVDDERIFSYRLLAVARGDTRPLAGFDEQAYVRAAGFEDRPLADLLDDYCAVRQATIALLDGLPPGAWLRRSTVNGYSATVRGLAFHIAGHELRHVRAIRDRYLTLLT